MKKGARRAQFNDGATIAVIPVLDAERELNILKDTLQRHGGDYGAAEAEIARRRGSAWESLDLQAEITALKDKIAKGRQELGLTETNNTNVPPPSSQPAKSILKPGLTQAEEGGMQLWLTKMKLQILVTLVLNLVFAAVLAAIAAGITSYFLTAFSAATIAAHAVPAVAAIVAAVVVGRGLYVVGKLYMSIRRKQSTIHDKKQEIELSTRMIKSQRMDRNGHPPVQSVDLRPDPGRTDSISQGPDGSGSESSKAVPPTPE